MSVVPLKADIYQGGLRVRFVPQADIRNRGRWGILASHKVTTKTGVVAKRAISQLRLRNRWRCGPRHVGTRQGIGFRRDVVQRRLDEFSVPLELLGASLKADIHQRGLHVR